MDILLAPQRLRFLDELVQRGDYPDAAATLDEGLRLLELQHRREELNKGLLEAHESIQKGGLTELDMDGIKGEARRRAGL
ncbi:MAG: type II toxin-antitoxin system ParD family antitoxin [Acidobacteriota bacterium]